jgi:protein involved in polysaccharide export with SLBB domain
MKKILFLLSLITLVGISTSFAASLTDDPYSAYPTSSSSQSSSFSTADDRLNAIRNTGSKGSQNFADPYGRSDSFYQSDSSSATSSGRGSGYNSFQSSGSFQEDDTDQQMRQGDAYGQQQLRTRDLDQYQYQYQYQDQRGQQYRDDEDDDQQQDYDQQYDAGSSQRQYLDLQQRQGVRSQQRQEEEGFQRLNQTQDSQQRQDGDAQQRQKSSSTDKQADGDQKDKKTEYPLRSTRKVYRKVAQPAPASPIEQSLSEAPLTAENVRPQPYRIKPLKQFGYNFFKQKTNFAPLTDVPVGPDYVINPGDRLQITVWGGYEGTFNREVNRSGEIVLPKVGSVKVAGQCYSQLPELLKVTFSRIFKGVNLNVNMSKLRLVKVYVVGEVAAPGDYNVTSLSTVISALSAAGGPTKNGSLRNIQIKRNGKLVETVDLYDFFLKGDKGRDIRLQPGDTVLVPVVGPVAGVAGNVRRPAIYELKGERTLNELLALADGINPSGYLQRVQLYRVQAHEKKMVTDINLDLKGEKEKSVAEVTGGIAINDLDVVKVLPIDSVLRGYVRLTGHVLRPGDYALKPGMKVSALLGGDNLLPEYFTGAGQIVRLCPPDQHPEVLFFDLSKALKGDPAHDLELKEFDRVKIFTRREMQETPYVKVNGEVQKPGQVRYLENMTVRDLLLQAGNVKNNAYLKNAEVTRLKWNGDSVTSYSISVDLGKALEGGAENIRLQPFDELTVRRIPNWSESTERYVTLNGEFVFPGTYPIHKGERLSSVIERAGGFTDRAYLNGAKFTRELARQLQQQRMDEALVKAQEDIIKLQTKMAQTAASAEEAASAKETLSALMQGVEVLKTKKAEGRMLVDIVSLRDLKGSVYDLELQGGDQVSVPSDPGGVNVIGDVYNQNTVVSQAGKTVQWYLSQVGGATGDADLSEVYVVKVDGSVISQKNTRHFLWYNAFWGKKLDSGDTIIVPRQYEKTAWLRDIKDIAAILGNIAVTAGVLVAAGLF